MIKHYSSQDILHVPIVSKKTKEISYTTVVDGIVLPLQFLNDSPMNGSGGVLTANGDFTEASGLTDSYLQYGKSYTFDNPLLQKYDEEVIWFGIFINHWGHFLIELIGRMWYVLENYKHQKIIYISKVDHMFKGVFSEFMSYLNIPEDRLVRVDMPSQYSKVIVPDYCATEHFYSDLYREIFKKVVDNSGYRALTLDTGKNIYFSRKDFFYSKFKDFGESPIEDAFNANNFESLSPEKLTLKEQIYLWNTSDHIAAVNGTIPLNILFSFNHPHLIVLNKTSLIHTTLVRIQKVCNFEITYIDVFHPRYSASAKTLGGGPFIMYVSPNLKNFFIDSNLRLPISTKDSVQGLQSFFYFSKFHLLRLAIAGIRKLNLKAFFMRGIKKG